MIELLPVDPMLLEAALEGGWLEDRETNRVMGFGSEPGNFEDAAKAFLKSSENGMLGIYKDAKAVGWVSIEQEAPGCAQVAVFVAPEHRRQGIATQAIEQMVKELMDLDYRRVAAEVNEINRPARELFHSCGFCSEGKRWLSVVVDGKAYDTMSWVMTPHIWRKRHRKETQDGVL